MKSEYVTIGWLATASGAARAPALARSLALGFLMGGLSAKLCTLGSIPARAWEPDPRPAAGLRRRVYPRACGVTGLMSLDAADRTGVDTRTCPPDPRACFGMRPAPRLRHRQQPWRHGAVAPATRFSLPLLDPPGDPPGQRRLSHRASVLLGLTGHRAQDGHQVPCPELAYRVVVVLASAVRHTDHRHPPRLGAGPMGRPG